MTYISPHSQIAAGVYIGRNVVILGQTRIGRGSIVEDNCIIGKPSRSQIVKFREELNVSGRNSSYAEYEKVVDTPIEIGEDVQLHAGTIIYSGVKLGNAVICEDRSTVRWDTTIGDCSEVKYGGLVWSYVTIGQHCRIGGYCANDSYLGNYVSSFGNLIHAYIKYGGGRRDPAPRLEDRVTVGFGAQVIGGVTVHHSSYVTAGSVVTKDVPANTVVINRNKHVLISNWKGRLQDAYLDSFPMSDPKE